MHKRDFKLAWCLAALVYLLMTGCSLFDKKSQFEQPPQAYDWPVIQLKLSKLESWQLMGKIGIRTPQESMSAAINSWTQVGELYDLQLSSTFLGLGAAHLRGNRVFVTLEESGEPPVFSDQPDLLIEQSLGFPLPISHLQYWVKGLPAPGAHIVLRRNDRGLPTRLKQFGWSLSFEKHTEINGLPLPGKIKLQRGEVRIILAIKEWNML